MKLPSFPYFPFLMRAVLLYRTISGMAIEKATEKSAAFVLF